MSAVLTHDDEGTRQGVVATQRELARALNRAPTTVNRWIRECPDFPSHRSADGGTCYVVDEVEQWMRAQQRRDRSRRAPSPDVDDDELAEAHYKAKVEKEHHNARILKIKADALEGRYVERSEYESAVTEIAAVFRRVLGEQPERFRADEGDEAADVAQRVVDRVWSELEQARDEALSALPQEESDEDE